MNTWILMIFNYSEFEIIPELRSELIGLLTMASGSGIVKTLEKGATTSLAATLESRKNEDWRKEEEK